MKEITMSSLTDSSTPLTRLYASVERTGILELPLFKLLFQELYFKYKAFLEDPFEKLAKKYPDLFKNGHIVDVGANIGYTSMVFAKALSPGFKVIAFEPEEKNFAQLKSVLKRYGLDSKAEAVQSAVGAENGKIDLWFNKAHHADHRILTKEFEQTLSGDSHTYSVPLYSIDSYLEKLEKESIEGLGGSPVSFVKIDVQGYELPVCHGMKKTLQANPNLSVAFEYAPLQMKELGFEGSELLAFFKSRDFNLYAVNRTAELELFDESNLEKYMRVTPYFDLLACRQKLL